MPEPEASYVCSACGEEIVVPAALSAGHALEYVEDCPVCCRPHRLCVQADDDGRVTVLPEAE